MQRNSARVDNTTLLTRIDEVRQMCGKAQKGQQDILELLEKQQIEIKSQAEKQIEKLHHVQDQVSEAEQNSHRILSVARDMLRGIVEVKDLLLSVSQTVTHSQITSSNGIFMRFLDPTKELPVVLEDALGRSLPIPAQWIDTLDWSVSCPAYKLHKSFL